LVIKLQDKTISIREIVDRIESENGTRTGYASSFTLRLPQLISYQVRKLVATFSKVMKAKDYRGEFSAVYPVKVNQRRDYVVQVLHTNPDYGIEAGTKAELFLIKSVLEKEKHRLIICNGAKDPEYLNTIKECIEEGFNIAVSIESLHEAQLIIDRFRPEQVNLVLRIKPYLTVRGHWSHSAGRDSKFGLSIHDLFDVVDLLKEKGFQDSVSTILGHVGSQITAIEDLVGFAEFMTRAFMELRQKRLANLKLIDFGGGLPIDYTSSYAPNLMEQYAESLVTGIQNELSNWPKGLTPNIIVESGRGLTALGSLVLIKALEVRSVFPQLEEIGESSMDLYKALVKEIADAASVNELAEVWNDFQTGKSTQVESLDALRAREALIGQVRAEIRRQIARLGASSLRSDALSESLWHPDHIVIGNFSVFNSVCDYVLVKQHFPIVPMQDLHLHPETTVRLVDLTCDSDGEISQFHRKGTGEIWFTRDYRPVTMPIGQMGQGIPVGSIENTSGSYFAIALTGAYQDVIEMNHNLLGDLPDVELILDKKGKWQVRWMSGAESMEDILEEMGYIGFDIDEDPYIS
jgi:arginine decarboxylase